MNNEEKILAMLDQMQGDIASLKSGQSGIKEQQEVHTKAIMSLENNVMRELGMLNELLPDTLAKREAFEDVASKVDDHGSRIFALEQKVAQ